MNNLAVLYASQKKYGPAEDYYRKSIAIWEKAYGPAHPDVAEGLNNLALLFAEQGRYREAHDLFTRAQAIDKKVIDQVLGFTSEEKKTQFLALKQTSMEQALSMVAQHMKTDPKARRDAYNVCGWPAKASSWRPSGGTRRPWCSPTIRKPGRCSANWVKFGRNCPGLRFPVPDRKAPMNTAAN